jgi:DNA-binding Lrp family transcriptional regulator
MRDSAGDDPQSILTDLDRRIISELEHDPLASSQEIANSLSVTRAQVLNRLRHIEANEALHVIAQINATYGGHVLCHAYIQVQGRSVANVAADLGGQPETQMVVRLLGEDDLLAVFRVHGSRPAGEIMERVSKVPGVVGLRYEHVLKVLYARTNRIAFRSVASAQPLLDRRQALARDLEPLGLDELDLSIIAYLGDSARKSMRAIARDTGVTEGAIRYRVRNLQTKGIITITTAVDPTALGLNTFAALDIEAEANALSTLAEELRTQAWTQYIALLTGRRNLRCVTLTKDLVSLGRAVEWVRGRASVRTVAPHPMLEFYKLDRRWASQVTPEP